MDGNVTIKGLINEIFYRIYMEMYGLCIFHCQIVLSCSLYIHARTRQIFTCEPLVTKSPLKCGKILIYFCYDFFKYSINLFDLSVK